ncbi:hypothetical protein BHE74_00055830 [Ensete ventricosum]|nr:hypothetical protein BHE74_00055830 [Ensete ventricosum]RZR76151.1 hypothetical protein BHM03_00000775 [Ensete ventricosum]
MVQQKNGPEKPIRRRRRSIYEVPTPANQERGWKPPDEEAEGYRRRMRSGSKSEEEGKGKGWGLWRGRSP